MPGEDAEDERASGPPPSPADRPWVHPSELTAFVATGRPAPPPRSRLFAALGLVVMVAAAGVLAAVLARSPSRTGEEAVVRSGPTRELISTVEPSVVKVVAVQPDGQHVASGVSIGAGRILTNMRAVEGSLSIVIVASGRMVAATKTGADPVTDLALLAVPDGTVPPVELGRSAGLETGQSVVGIAASQSHRWVDLGTVAAFDQAFESASFGVVPGLLDTDLTAGQEHAGGALVDEQGRLVGVLVVPPQATTSGLAIPIDDALAVADELEKTGQARHGWMGVSVADATDRSGGGAVVREVVPSSPGEKAALREGDVIVAIADESGTTAISGMEKLMAEVRRHLPGDRLEMTFYRDGGQRHVRVVLGDRPENAPAATPAPTEPQPAGS